MKKNPNKLLKKCIETSNYTNTHRCTYKKIHIFYKKSSVFWLNNTKTASIMMTKVSPVHLPGSKTLIQPLLSQKRINNWFLACWLNHNITKVSFNLRYLFFFAKSTKWFLIIKMHYFALFIFGVVGKSKTEIFFSKCGLKCVLCLTRYNHFFT